MSWKKGNDRNNMHGATVKKIVGYMCYIGWA